MDLNASRRGLFGVEALPEQCGHYSGQYVPHSRRSHARIA